MRLVCRWCGYEAPGPLTAQCPGCHRIARWMFRPDVGAGEPSTLTFTYMDKKFLKLLHIDPEH